MGKVRLIRGPLDGTTQDIDKGMRHLEWRRLERIGTGMTSIPTVRSYVYRLTEELTPDGENIAYFMYEG